MLIEYKFIFVYNEGYGGILMEIHNIQPIYDENSNILILGSFPSVKSREENFFYAHPQNRFWRVISAIYSSKTPETIEDKKNFLINHKIALWDVIESCEINGSSDSSIKSVTPNRIDIILNTAKIQKIFTNGKASHRLFEKYIAPKCNVGDICLPSTSPANAAYSLEQLCLIWSDEIGKYIT